MASGRYFSPSYVYQIIFTVMYSDLQNDNLVQLIQNTTFLNQEKN